MIRDLLMFVGSDSLKMRLRTFMMLRYTARKKKMVVTPKAIKITIMMKLRL